MNIINIGFTGINANRQSIPKGNVSITNNVKVLSVEEAKMGLDQSRQAFKVIFSFKTEYTPNFASLEVKGEVLILGTVEETKKMLDQWNKEKRLNPEFSRVILNNIMNRCSLEVILLSKELGLPSPIPLPSIKAEGVSQAPAKAAPKAEKAPKKK